PVSHESLYPHVYADKAHGGTLWKSLRCQKQKRKRYASGRSRRGQMPNRMPLSVFMLNLACSPHGMSERSYLFMSG
ncbi:MAG: hypothetical protein QE279_11790, partial [Rhodoferax sp.]|nr:hypothetical protein [Rhodoferax sp.]